MSARRQSLLLGLVAALLYTATAARSVQGGDAGEFMTLAAVGGVAHPPGYPVLTWLLRGAVALLPVGSVAWRASLVSALLAATALALLHAALQRLTRSSLAALVAAASLGLSPLFWRYATVAEVFAGAALTACWLLWLLARVVDGWRGWRPALLLGLVAASGVANHHTTALLAPLGLLALWQLLRGLAWPARAALLGWLLLGLAPGVLSYGVLLVDSGGLRWGEPASLGDLLRHLLRADYGTFALAHGGEAVAWWQHPARLLARVPGDFFYLFALLALLGLWRGLRRREQRGLWLAVALSWLLCGPLLLARFNLPTTGEAGVMTLRFHILPGVLAAALAGLGWAELQRALPWLQRRSTTLALAGVLCCELVLHLPKASHARSSAVEDVARHALGVVPRDAVIVGSGDSMMGAVLYLQEVQGLRRDVAFVYPGVLPAAWYRRWLHARHPDLGLDALDAAPAIVALIRLWQGQRPVYLTHAWAAAPEVQPALVRAQVVGEVLVRVEVAAASPPQVPADSRTALVASCPAFTVDPAALDEVDQRFEAWALEQCALGAQDRALRAMLAGQPEVAAEARARALHLAPWLFEPR